MASVEHSFRVVVDGTAERWSLSVQPAIRGATALDVLSFLAMVEFVLGEEGIVPQTDDE